MIALLFRAGEDVARPPLFARRGAFQCSWPLWSGPEPLHEKRCCGEPVAVAGQPYCRAHDQLAKGTGTRAEREAEREPSTFIVKDYRHA